VKYLIFPLFLILISCNKSSVENVLVSVYNNKLYYDDVIEELPSYVNDTDLFINQYVDDWIREKVMLCCLLL